MKGKARTVTVVRHAERVDMESAGGGRWFVDPQWRQSVPAPLLVPPRDHVEAFTWDPPLTPVGVRQAQAAARRLRQQLQGESVAVVCSPALRCQQTASQLAQELGVEFFTAECLFEFMNAEHRHSGKASRWLQDFGGEGDRLPWCRVQELQDAGMPAFQDESWEEVQATLPFNPVMPSESFSNFCDRNILGTRALLEYLWSPGREDTPQHVVLVGHQTTAFMVSHALVDPSLLAPLTQESWGHGSWKHSQVCFLSRFEEIDSPRDGNATLPVFCPCSSLSLQQFPAYIGTAGEDSCT